MVKKNSQIMNEELMGWVKETKKEMNFSKKSKEKGDKPKGLCNICGENKAKFICIKCGKNVCLSCHFKIIGICKMCIPKETTDKWEGKPPDWEKLLGVEWVD